MELSLIISILYGFSKVFYWSAKVKENSSLWGWFFDQTKGFMDLICFNNYKLQEMEKRIKRNVKHWFRQVYPFYPLLRIKPLMHWLSNVLMLLFPL